MLSPATLAAVERFATDRDWTQFHSPENLAKSISIEAGELLECYQWGAETADSHDVADELADVLTYGIHLARVLGLDLDEIVLNKLAKSAEKYPVEKSRGNTAKYDSL